MAAIVAGSSAASDSRFAKNRVVPVDVTPESAVKSANSRIQRMRNAEPLTMRGVFCNDEVTMKNGKIMTLKMRIFETFEDPSYTVFAKWYSVAMMVLIVLATVCYVLESETQLPDGGLYATGAAAAFSEIELFAVVIFSIEYIIRFLCCPCDPCPWGFLNFLFNFQNIVDLLACAPYWVTFIMQLVNPEATSTGLGFVRVIRLVRIFRIFKLGKYSSGIQMFAGALNRSLQSLSILVLLVILAVVIFSSIMHIAEGTVAIYNTTSYDEGLLAMAGVDAEKHLYCFGTIPRCFWWAFVTMTTVGYGDCFPITPGGKVLAMFTMLLGVLIIAMPITVVGSNFQKMVEMYEEDAGSLREFDLSKDGTIDEMELREFLFAMRKNNALRKDVDCNATRLIAKYDPQGNGTLSYDEFANLKRDIIDPSAADPQTNMRTLLKRTAELEIDVHDIKQQLTRIEVLLGGKPPPQKASPYGMSSPQVAATQVVDVDSAPAS